MQQIIGFLLSNFTLNFLVIAAIATVISVSRKGRDHLPEAAIAYYCLFAMGFTFLANFVMHLFYGEMIAAFIGWDDSPFQAEVAWASLGYALIGFLAFRGGFEMRLAAVAAPSIFLLGAAVGHVYQMVTAHNFAPGNAGVVFWTDIFVPIIGGILLWWRYGNGRDRKVVSG
jgi:hypothetical protein